MTDTPESVRKIAACVPFIDTNGGVNETQEALERYADLLERIEKAPVMRVEVEIDGVGLMPVSSAMFGKIYALLQVEE
jgi:hypothetical protein